MSLPRILDALRFRTGDVHRRSDRSASAPLNCMLGASPSVVLINVVMDAGTQALLVPAVDNPADVRVVGMVAVVGSEGMVVPVWWFGLIGERWDYVWRHASWASVLMRRHAVQGDATGYAWQWEMEGCLRGGT